MVGVGILIIVLFVIKRTKFCNWISLPFLCPSKTSTPPPDAPQTKPPEVVPSAAAPAAAVIPAGTEACIAQRKQLYDDLKAIADALGVSFPFSAPSASDQLPVCEKDVQEWQTIMKDITAAMA